MAIEALRRCLETADWERLGEVYAEDALFDCNVPEWRFQRKGLGEIAVQYRDWYPEPPRRLEWKETPTDFGAVVEQADWTSEGGEEQYSRSLHLLHVDGGRIVRHVLYCTGWWDQATVQRQAREAPSYET